MEKTYPEERVTSSYRPNVYEALLEIANRVDFSAPDFRFKRKRNRSIGSAQALLVELALQSSEVRSQLRELMSEHWTPKFCYLDQYHTNEKGSQPRQRP